MENEVLDVIDKKNTVLYQETRGVVHKNGLPHRVAVVLVKRNSDEKYLIPSANIQKVEKGLYHSAAGHVASGESYKITAVRELLEETGLSISVDDLTSKGFFWLEKKYETRKENERIEVFEYSIDHTKKILFNEEQINEQWLSLLELNDIYTHNPEKLSYHLFLTCKNILF